MCAKRTEPTTAVRRKHIDPFYIAWIVERLVRQIVNETYGHHEALRSCGVKRVSRVKSISFIILHNLRIVPCHHVLEFHCAKQEQKVVQDEGHAPSKVALNHALALAIEVRQQGREAICLQEHVGQTDPYGARNYLIAHFLMSVKMIFYLFQYFLYM